MQNKLYIFRNKAKNNRKTLRKENKNMIMDKIALFILFVGGLNWGLVGIFSFDLVAWLFGGTGALLSRVVYILVALSAVWCITLLFREPAGAEARGH